MEHKIIQDDIKDLDGFIGLGGPEENLPESLSFLKRYESLLGSS